MQRSLSDETAVREIIQLSVLQSVMKIESVDMGALMEVLYLDLSFDCT